MSTLTVTTISNGTISTSTANVINGAKAWVNFNGTGTVAIRASYNVSSITDNGTGDYTVNFTNAFADANYSGQYMLSQSRQFIKTAANGGADPTTTQFRLQSLDSTGTAVDAAFNLLAFFR